MKKKKKTRKISYINNNNKHCFTKTQITKEKIHKGRNWKPPGTLSPFTNLFFFYFLVGCYSNCFSFILFNANKYFI